jgi:hypothetical protein
MLASDRTSTSARGVDQRAGPFFNTVGPPLTPIGRGGRPAYPGDSDVDSASRRRSICSFTMGASRALTSSVSGG